MAKRANGEGSIRKRKDGKWLVTFPTGLYKENGKREYVYEYCATQAEAVEALRQLQNEKAVGVCRSKAAIKTGDWIHTWIEKYKAPHLAPSTLTSYRNNFRVHIRPYVGEIALKDLTTYHIQKMLDNGNFRFSLFIKVRNVIHGALEQAVELGMIPKNPCKGVAYPKDDRKDVWALTKEEQQRLIAALDGEYYRTMLLTYLYTGMRAGEGIPLQWKDIDLNKRTIRVNKKAILHHDYATHSGKQEIQDFCKTESSKRTIVITAGLVAILAEHKEEMKKRAAALGLEWSEDSLVFWNTRNKIVQYGNLKESLNKIYRKVGIENATMHTLRHTYATRCFEAGVDIKAISEQLGHANVKTTYNIYVHLLEDTKVKEIDKLSEIDKFIALEDATESAVVIPFPESGKAV
ncbi:tyrosine-type recombinase/integrase [Pseudoflavonifractor phocaeensis]|uniref:tyrosine-type recombinase/integrase n=1 Tax=Pseudoflavonifractor phocaeensis TaxID=1870988 RepID=UPI001957BE51|nr:site-specific integrase [Pseudoflavonifractor phocaeensis]MBM6885929.1 site-specific integrase [Pseudoflavonifractor phocaeensis]